MKKFYLCKLCLVVFGALLAVQSVSATEGDMFFDSDWTVGFHEDCGFPNDSFVGFQGEDPLKYLRISLPNRAKGRCSRDGISRARAPYWERAELISGPRSNKKTLLSGKYYEVSARVRFVSGFDNDRESILQIYTPCAFKGRCYPAVMVRSGYRGNPMFYLDVLHHNPNSRSKDRWKNFNKKSVVDEYKHRAFGFYSSKTGLFRAPEHLGERVLIQLWLAPNQSDIAVTGRISASENIWKVKTQNAAKARLTSPYLKIGIYRPGDESGNGNSESTIDFDFVQIKEITKDKYEKAITF